MKYNFAYHKVFFGFEIFSVFLFQMSFIPYNKDNNNDEDHNKSHHDSNDGAFLTDSCRCTCIEEDIFKFININIYFWAFLLFRLICIFADNYRDRINICFFRFASNLGFRSDGLNLNRKCKIQFCRLRFGFVQTYFFSFSLHCHKNSQKKKNLDSQFCRLL